MRPGEMSLQDLQLPIAIRPSNPVSAEDLMRFSERNKPYKIERNKDGEITVMTPVGGIGGTHEFYVASMFFAWVEANPSGVGFASNTGFNLPDGSILSPDVAWLSLPRWSALTPDQQAGYPPLCPEFLIEIRSRSDSRRLLESKMQLWLDNGAQLAWLIDPIESSVTVYRPGQPSETLQRPDLVIAQTPVEGFSLSCTRLWPAT